MAETSRRLSTRSIWERNAKSVSRRYSKFHVLAATTLFFIPNRDSFWLADGGRRLLLCDILFFEDSFGKDFINSFPTPFEVFIML